MVNKLNCRPIFGLAAVLPLIAIANPGDAESPATGSDALVLSIKARNSFDQVEPVKIDISVKNKSEDSIVKYMESNLYKVFMVYVHREGEDASSPTRYREFLDADILDSSRPMVFKSNDSFETFLFANLMYDMTIPGSYWVSVECKFPGDKHVMKSNKIKVTVSSKLWSTPAAPK